MYKKKQMNNGLTIIVSPMSQMTSVSLGVWIGTGGRYESLRQSGMSHFVEHMLFKGTYTRSTKDLKEAIEGVGGSFNAFTSDEVTCYMVKVPAKYMELGLDVLSDMVLNAKFDEEEIAREKFVICEEIKMYQDQPSDHVLEMLGEIMWKDNPLGRPLTGKISNVKSFKRKEIVGYRDKNYHSGNIAVVAAGKMDVKKLYRSVEKSFSGQKRRKKTKFISPVIRQKKPVTRFKKEEIKQTHIAMGFHALDRDIRERFSFKMMSIVLGGNMSSRLFEELREKRGLCYDISAMYKRHKDVGDLVIHSGVDNRKAFGATEAIISELKKMKNEKISSDELSRAKEYAKGQFSLAMESTYSRMLWLGERFMCHKHIPEVKDVLKRIDGVTAGDIKKVSAKIFNPDSLSLAMIGNLRRSEEIRIAKKLATI